MRLSIFNSGSAILLLKFVTSTFSDYFILPHKISPSAMATYADIRWLILALLNVFCHILIYISDLDININNLICISYRLKIINIDIVLYRGSHKRPAFFKDTERSTNRARRVWGRGRSHL